MSWDDEENKQEEIPRKANGLGSSAIAGAVVTGGLDLLVGPLGIGGLTVGLISGGCIYRKICMDKQGNNSGGRERAYRETTKHLFGWTSGANLGVASVDLIRGLMDYLGG